jgi:hypothetical protein
VPSLNFNQKRAFNFNFTVLMSSIQSWLCFFKSCSGGMGPWHRSCVRNRKALVRIRPMCVTFLGIRTKLCCIILTL